MTPCHPTFRSVNVANKKRKGGGIVEKMVISRTEIRNLWKKTRGKKNHRIARSPVCNLNVIFRSSRGSKYLEGRGSRWKRISGAYVRRDRRTIMQSVAHFKVETPTTIYARYYHHHHYRRHRRHHRHYRLGIRARRMLEEVTRARVRETVDGARRERYRAFSWKFVVVFVVVGVIVKLFSGLPSGW